MKIKDETDNNRDDHITAFPAALDTSIKSFEDGINATLQDKHDMTDDENAAAIARNSKSLAIALEYMNSAKARGETIQEVKEKLIWWSWS